VASLLIAGWWVAWRGLTRVYEAEKPFGNDSDFPLFARACSFIAAGRVSFLDCADSMRKYGFACMINVTQGEDEWLSVTELSGR
jgi:hypothetical protein